MGLFVSGVVTLSSGKKSSWKIECDALDGGDWSTLARLAKGILPGFSQVYGIPTGGDPFAERLRDHVDPRAPYVLIADDVYTTGGSMERERERLIEIGHLPERIIGVVAFSRALTMPYWIAPLFCVHPNVASGGA